MPYHIKREELEKTVAHMGECQSEILSAIEARKGPEIGVQGADLVARTAACVASLEYGIQHFNNEMISKAFTFSIEAVLRVGVADLSLLLKRDVTDPECPEAKEFMGDVIAIARQSLGYVYNDAES